MKFIANFHCHDPNHSCGAVDANGKGTTEGFVFSDIIVDAETPQEVFMKIIQNVETTMSAIDSPLWPEHDSLDLSHPITITVQPL